MIDRSQMNEELAQRTASSYQTRDSGMKFPDVYKPELGIRTWYAKEGEHEIDILSFQVGPNDQHVKEGRWSHFFDMWIHRRVGPGDLQFICLMAMYNGRCFICEYRNQLLSDAPEDMSKKDAKQFQDNVIYPLKPSRQGLYNIICYDSEEEEAKGVQLWQVAHFFFEKHIVQLSKINKSRGGGYVLFSHPDKENGKTISFVRKGKENTTYDGHQFHDRNYDLNDEELDACRTLDQIIVIPTYEEVKEAFWDSSEVEEEAPEDTPRGRRRAAVQDDTEPEEETRATRRKNLATQAEAQPQSEPETKEEFEQEQEAEQEAEPEEETSAPRSRRRPAPEPEEQAMPPRRRAAVQPDEDVRPGRRSANITVDNEETGAAPPPRRKRASPVEDETPKASGLRRVGAVAKKECPVPGGKFGVDTQAFDECETCEFWNPCLEAKEKDGPLVEDDIPF